MKLFVSLLVVAFWAWFLHDKIPSQSINWDAVFRGMASGVVIVSLGAAFFAVRWLWGAAKRLMGVGHTSIKPIAPKSDRFIR